MHGLCGMFLKTKGSIRSYYFNSPLYQLPNEKAGRLLLSEIMKGGNFGCYDKRKKVKFEGKRLMMLVNLVHSV